jgi:hypothetical protein
MEQMIPKVGDTVIVVQWEWERRKDLPRWPERVITVESGYFYTKEDKPDSSVHQFDIDGFSAGCWSETSLRSPIFYAYPSEEVYLYEQERRRIDEKLIDTEWLNYPLETLKQIDAIITEVDSENSDG